MPTESVPLSLPPGIEAFVAYPEGKGPGRDRKGRLRVRRVTLTAEYRGQGFDPPVDLSKKDLVWLLKTGHGKRLWKGIETRWGAQAGTRLEKLVRCGAITVDVPVDDHRRVGVPISFSLSDAWAQFAPDKLRDLTGRGEPAVVRGALLDLIRGVEQLADEYKLLAAQELDAPLSAPEGSATGTPSWSPYEFALRLAHWWWVEHDRTRTPVPREALAHSHAHTKGTKENWKTSARMRAFENLMDAPFSAHFDGVDYDIRVRGPIRWRDGTVLADAHTARPWVGLPSNGARLMGGIDTTGAQGVFVVENQETFHVVSQMEEITRRWVCVWGKGMATEGTVEFLRLLDPLPVAVWGDLDASGIAIVVDLATRIDRPVHPVGMGVHYWLTGPYLRIDERNRQDNVALATSLLDRVPPELQPLVEQIARHPEHAGKVLEQEGQHPKVLPLLPGLLDRVLDAHRAES